MYFNVVVFWPEVGSKFLDLGQNVKHLCPIAVVNFIRVVCGPSLELHVSYMDI
jgi:hypothetical protein